MKLLIYLIGLVVSPLLIYATDLQVDVIEEGKKIKIKMGDKKNKITVSTPEHTALEGKPQIYGDSNFALVYLQYFDHDSGTTMVYALNNEAKTIWSMELGSFNPSKPLIEEDHVYIGAVGKIWKLNKKSGEIIWTHKDLYKKAQYNGAEQVRRKNSTIVFSDKLKVNDNDGQILEVK